jgi:hypothetical protein
MQKPNQQKVSFLKYLSLVPVLAVVLTSGAFSIWMIFNYFFPDLLFYP